MDLVNRKYQTANKDFKVTRAPSEPARAAGDAARQRDEIDHWQRDDRGQTKEHRVNRVVYYFFPVAWKAGK